MNKQPVILGVVPSDLNFWFYFFHMVFDSVGPTNVLLTDRELNSLFNQFLSCLDSRYKSFFTDAILTESIGPEKAVYFSEV